MSWAIDSKICVGYGLELIYIFFLIVDVILKYIILLVKLHGWGSMFDFNFGTIFGGFDIWGEIEISFLFIVEEEVDDSWCFYLFVLWVCEQFDVFSKIF